MAATNNALMNRPKTEPAVVASVKDLLRANWRNITGCLPKHMTPERLCMVAMQTIAHTPTLLDCTPESLAGAIVEASTLGLEVDLRGQAYLVPFINGKNGNRKEVQLIPGYKGLMELGYRSGRVTAIYAEVVYENDYFEVVLGLTPDIKHTPGMGDRGEMMAVYAVARMRDGDPLFTFMTRDDVYKVRDTSKAKDKGPWKTHEAEMWKKTAIRRLCKTLPLSPEVQNAAALDERADLGESQNLAAKYFDGQQIAAPANSAAALNSALNNSEAIDVQAREKPAPVERQAKQPTKGRVQGPYAQPAPEAQAEPQAPAASGDKFSCPIPTADGGERMVTDADCAGCSSRNGCPNWSEF